MEMKTNVRLVGVWRVIIISVIVSLKSARVPVFRGYLV